MNGGSFNVDSQVEPTNKDITVVFSPFDNVVKYNYTIYKSGKKIDSVTTNGNKPSEIVLDDSGNYQITVLSYDAAGGIVTTNSGVYIIDKEPPVIDVASDYIKVIKGEEFNAVNGVRAFDEHDGEITESIVTNEIDLSREGKNKLTYVVSDAAGNTATKTVFVEVNDIGRDLFVIYLSAVIILFLIIVPIFRVRKTFKLEKRLDPFVIEPKNGGTVSIFDHLFTLYHKIIEYIVKIFSKSEFAKKYAKKLDKYISVSVLHNSGMEIFAGKIIIALIFAVVATFVTAMQLNLLSLAELVIPMIIGFFVLDVLYFVKYRAYRMKLENDLLSAIIVMNNAFKSGRSITQAIEIVGDEIDGEIGREFKKMYLELSYGLGIDVIFSRFASRMKMDEVNYLTASLTILNKTGGNIIKVFDAIEKTLFNKKKLRLELKSLTSSSRIIVYVLFAVPFLFVLFISIINPEYFLPFVTTKVGVILLIGMIIYYIIFVVCVRKIMKVVI